MDIKINDTSPAAPARGRCPGCGARYPRGAEQCPYCGTWLEVTAASGGQTSQAPVTPLLPEFGLGHRVVVTMLAFVLPLSLAGWWFEYPNSYWSSDSAIAVWCGVVPAWTLLTGLAWRKLETRWLGAVASFLLTAVPFAFVVMLRRGRMSDDALGLASFVGGCAAISFVVGLLLNYRVRRMRARPPGEHLS